MSVSQSTAIDCSVGLCVYLQICRCNEYELAAKRQLKLQSQPLSESVEEKVREVEVGGVVLAAAGLDFV